VPSPRDARARAPALAGLGLLLASPALAVNPPASAASAAAPAAAAVAPAPASPAAAPDAPGAPGALGEAPSREEIAQALARLRADPNLGKETRVRTLRFNTQAAATPQTAPAWLANLFAWIAQSLSVLLWIAGGLLLAVAAVWVLRVVRAKKAESAAVPAALPTARAELDLRPESLPADVGAAALALLEAGRVREALSLLYRGALSRAVHRFAVAIQPSATEGEALRAVRTRLDAARGAYFSELIGLWQSMVYAGSEVPHEAIAGLCARFAPLLESGAA